MEKLAGALLALFYLSGRFSLTGGDDNAAPASLLDDVRLWALFALVFVAVTYAPPKSRILRPGQYVSTRLAPVLALLLPLYVCLSYVWAIDLELATMKMLDAVMLATACVSMTPFLKTGRIAIVRNSFWIWIVFATGLMCLLACTNVDSTRISVLGGGPNVFGRNMGLLFLGSLYMQRRCSAFTAWRWYPVMALSLLMVVLSGSRGALLATSVGIFIYMLIDSRFRTRNVLAAGCFVVVVQLVLMSTEMGERAYEMFESRILNLTLEQRHMSGREDLFASAYELGFERPLFGQGLAGYTIRLGHNYPHNIVLELFCETGITGVSLLAFLLLATISFGVRYRRHCDPAIWGAFGLTLASAMFSGNFFDSRGIFLMAMLSSQEIVIRRPAAAPVPARQPRIAQTPLSSYSPALPPRT